MIFTSGTQVMQKRTVSHDHYPYEIYYDGHASGKHCKQEIPPHYEVGHELRCIATVYNPRPEFVVLDNPILAGFRAEPNVDLWDMGFAMFTTYGGEKDWNAPGHYFHGFTIATPDQIDHARRVLTRLANWKDQ